MKETVVSRCVFLVSLESGVAGASSAQKKKKFCPILRAFASRFESPTARTNKSTRGDLRPSSTLYRSKRIYAVDPLGVCLPSGNLSRKEPRARGGSEEKRNEIRKGSLLTKSEKMRGREGGPKVEIFTVHL